MPNTNKNGWWEQATDGDCMQVIICAMRGRNPDKPSDRTKGIKLVQRLEIGGVFVTH